MHYSLLHHLYNIKYTGAKSNNNQFSISMKSDFNACSDTYFKRTMKMDVARQSFSNDNNQNVFFDIFNKRLNVNSVVIRNAINFFFFFRKNSLSHIDFNRILIKSKCLNTLCFLV